MFEKDYLMKMLSDLIQAMVRSMVYATEEENPYMAARSLENAIGAAVDMDAAIFLSLSPESMSMMMQISPIDERGSEYVARSLALASVYNREAGDTDLARLRMEQARVVADSFGIDLNGADFDESASIADAQKATMSHIDDIEREEYV